MSAILNSKNENVIETSNTHIHDCDPGDCEEKEIGNRIKGRAQYSTPTVAIANEISAISDVYAVQLAMTKQDKCCKQFCPSKTTKRDVSSITCPN